MHIISGKYKGAALKAPAGIRPTEDRVRKALFDILGDMTGCSFLELFAGSGAVGLEALSLGAQGVVLVEKDRTGLHAIRGNISGLKPQPSGTAIEVYQDDAMEAVSRLSGQGRRFDVIFADPPYYKGLSEKILQSIEEYDILNDISGFLIIQHFKKDPLPSKQGNLVLFKQSRYGDTVLSFYQHP
ncbi:MAG TPA: 16S rRNA (guanine(966)-N(2))-methyltransferase RsmD [Candidatus Omnitrophota bacterium]|nr:16S rRNA (guanine(966)-N(2))-methyltransferase RsmD [Candidatus Omnitrophota bacterium]